MAGPKTATGKAVAKLNAVAHGMQATQPVTPGEQADVWEAHRGAIVAALVPVGALEAALAERIALLLWRMGRVWRFETAVVTGNLLDIERDYTKREEEKQQFSLRHRHTFTPNTPAECREMIRDATATARLLRHLDTRRGEERIPGIGVGSILQEAVKVAVQQADDEEFDPDEVDYPGLPDDTDWDDLPDVTVATLRACFAALAAAAKTDVEQLVASTTFHYEGEARMAKLRLEEVEREIARMGAMRLLLPADLLDKVQRYEGHLHRQLIATMHEFEAMQARRQGQSAPLARLDVSGIDAAE